MHRGYNTTGTSSKTIHVDLTWPLEIQEPAPRRRRLSSQRFDLLAYQTHRGPLWFARFWNRLISRLEPLQCRVMQHEWVALYGETNLIVDCWYCLRCRAKERP